MKPTEEQIEIWYKELYRLYPNDLSHGKRVMRYPLRTPSGRK